jgi:type I restriction enzyme S subunit
MGTAERKKYSLKAGDLLFVRTNGRREYIGRCAVFQDQPEEALFASYLIRARLRREHVLPEFMQMYSTMPAGRANLSGRASGAADGKYNINTQILKSVMLPKPSLEEQAEIVRAVKAVSQKEAVAKKSVDALEQLFQSTLKALMTGNPRLVDLQVPEGLGG